MIQSIRTKLRTTFALALPVVALGVVASPSLGQPSLAAPQEGDDESPRPVYEPRANPQEEMKKAFADIERELRKIDRLLSDAGAGDIPLTVPDAAITDLPEGGGSAAGGNAAGIAAVLELSKEHSIKAVEGIDVLLELAEQNGGNCPSGSSDPSQGNQPSGNQSPDGEPSPLDGNPQPSPGDREQTPEMGREQPSQEQGGEEPQGEEEQQGGQEPKSPRGSDELGMNNPNDEPEGTTPGDPRSASGNDAWGDLPPRAREVFRNKGADDLPAEYRDWIDAYYRRLNDR